jgi:N-acetylated-alpha-linked acidic dipeptidase
MEKTPLLPPVSPVRVQRGYLIALQSQRRTGYLTVSIVALLLTWQFLLYRYYGNVNLTEANNSPSHKTLQDIFKDVPDNDKVRDWSWFYTSGPHMAGRNISQAEWTRDQWQNFGIQQSEIVPYDIYLNYPKDRRLALFSRASDKETTIFEASLAENEIQEDETTCLKESVPTFHAYSGSGNVTAPYVFANYGTIGDYQDLQDNGVNLTGKIALVKYGQVFRGLKVQRAEELGMVGVVMYSDPGDDASITERNGYDPYPDGYARESSSVQRGSTLFLTIAQGDPTTP